MQKTTQEKKEKKPLMAKWKKKKGLTFFVGWLKQLDCGMVALDYLVTVDSYPKPDDKIRCTSFQVQGGGNAMTCATRLGLTPRILSKVADDSQGKRILDELEVDGIDTSFIVVSQPPVKCESFCASYTFLLYARIM
ncbi:hypothetical protein MTR67_036942 [Solanum verrucosum]|uniref:Carbohydrate kinase PfkB domain-containing protein n=1 Tax=Solanum verrucosum TaxID=315347 RepID=A0AAF0UCP9_SOLVR|nr:hypothetical protein MTR67_036942 [Solanum verrucosum]